LSAVEVAKPPRITSAIGPSISHPASPLFSASGSKPSPVTVAVIKIGTSRSDAARVAVSRFHGRPSCETRCSLCDSSMMALRVVIPNNVTKPTSEPIVSEPALSAPMSLGAPHGQHAAGERERQVTQNHGDIVPAPEHHAKQHQDAHRGEGRVQQQLALRRFLRLGRTGKLEVNTLRQRHLFRENAPCVGDERLHVARGCR